MMNTKQFSFPFNPDDMEIIDGIPHQNRKARHKSGLRGRIELWQMM